MGLTVAFSAGSFCINRQAGREIERQRDRQTRVDDGVILDHSYVAVVVPALHRPARAPNGDVVFLDSFVCIYPLGASGRRPLAKQFVLHHSSLEVVALLQLLFWILRKSYDKMYNSRIQDKSFMLLKALSVQRDWIIFVQVFKIQRCRSG